jgi:hypothetical protein
MRKVGLEERAFQIYRRVPDVRPALAHIFADAVYLQVLVQSGRRSVVWWGGERKTNRCRESVNTCDGGMDPILVLILSHSHMLSCSSCPTASQRGKKIFTIGFEEGNGIGKGRVSVRRDVSAGTHVRDLWNHFFTLMGGREWITVGDDLLVGI